MSIVLQRRTDADDDDYFKIDECNAYFTKDLATCQEDWIKTVKEDIFHVYYIFYQYPFLIKKRGKPERAPMVTAYKYVPILNFGIEAGL